MAAKAEVVRKSPGLGRMGSIPIPGTNDMINITVKELQLLDNLAKYGPCFTSHAVCQATIQTPPASSEYTLVSVAASLSFWRFL